MTADAYYYDKTNYIMYEINDNNEAVVTRGAPRGATVILETVKENGKTYRVTAIAASAFKGNTNMTSISIPDGVTAIGDSAFYECQGLVSVTMPNSITSIGEFAFRSCKALTSISIPDGVKTIKRYTFDFCTKLSSIYLGTGLTEIEEAAFDYCSSLTSIVIPGNVKKIGYSAFSCCFALTSVVFSEGVEEIGDVMFHSCYDLASLTIPNSVFSIGTGAFEETAWYKNQPDGMVYAGKVFYRYKGFLEQETALTIEEGTIGIAGGAFGSCRNLTSVTIPNSVFFIGHDAFAGCREMTTATVPEGVSSIPYRTFEGCVLLTSVTLPSSVTCIGDYAFWFGGLVDLYCYATDVVEVGEKVFKETPIGTATLHVPASALDAYRTTAPWSGFGSIVALTDEVGIDQIDNGQLTMDNEAGAWFTLDGKRLNGKPANKGIFIQNDKKVMMR